MINKTGIKQNAFKGFKRLIMVKALIFALFFSLSPGIATADETGATFVRSLAKQVRISAQFAEGLVPFSSEKAGKAMAAIQTAAEGLAKTAKGDSPLGECGSKLAASSKRAGEAAEAGQGAFKSAYSELVDILRTCQQAK